MAHAISTMNMEVVSEKTAIMPMYAGFAEDPTQLPKCTKAGLPDHKDKGRPSQTSPKPSKS